MMFLIILLLSFVVVILCKWHDANVLMYLRSLASKRILLSKAIFNVITIKNTLFRFTNLSRKKEDLEIFGTIVNADWFSSLTIRNKNVVVGVLDNFVSSSFQRFFYHTYNIGLRTPKSWLRLSFKNSLIVLGHLDDGKSRSLAIDDRVLVHVSLDFIKSAWLRWSVFSLLLTLSFVEKKIWKRVHDASPSLWNYIRSYISIMHYSHSTNPWIYITKSFNIYPII